MTRFVAGERIEAGDPVHVASDGTVRRMTRETPRGDVVLEGGPADGHATRFDRGLPHTIQLEDGWHPVDEASGVSDEYVPTDRRDDAGRMIYVHRRTRYTAEGGVWRPA